MPISVSGTSSETVITGGGQSIRRPLLVRPVDQKPDGGEPVILSVAFFDLVVAVVVVVVVIIVVELTAVEVIGAIVVVLVVVAAAPVVVVVVIGGAVVVVGTAVVGATALHERHG